MDDNNNNNNTKITSFNDLPNEILRKIFSYLPKRDHYMVGLVSKRFQEILDSLKFQEEIILEITEKNVHEIKTAIANKNCKLIFKHLKIEDVTSIGDINFILQSIGKEIEHLSIKNTAVYGSLACNVINIKSLELHFDNVLRSSINNNFDLRVFPFLEKLVFKDNGDWYTETNGLLAKINDPETIITLKHLKIICGYYTEDVLIETLVHYTNTLETLDISFIDTNNTSNWYNIFPHMRILKKLILSGLVNQEMFNSFCKMPKESSLEHLELKSKLCKLTDEVLTSIVENWRDSLQYLELDCCENLTDVGVMKLGKLTKLRHLKLSNCIQITKMGLLMGIAVEKNLFIAVLYLENFTNLDELGMRIMMSRFPNLRVLNLRNIRNALTNDSLASVFRYQTRLKSLFIDGCSNITDEGLIGYENNPYSIRRLHLLEELTLNDCRYLTDETLIKGLHLPQLRSLQLARCRKITLKGIESMVRTCPSIEVLSVSSTAVVDDKALFVIGNGLKRLRQMNITACAFIPVNVRDHIRNVFDELKDSNTETIFAPNCVLNMVL